MFSRSKTIISPTESQLSKTSVEYHVHLSENGIPHLFMQ